MKKFLLVLTILGVGTVAHAQNLRETDDALDKVVLAMNLDGLAMANLEMKQELRLTEEQYTQIERVNEQRFLKMLEAEQQYAGNEILRSKTFRMINAESDQTLKEVLDAQQMKHFLEMEGRFNVQFVSENEEK
jgi:hypothetical protein